MITQNDLDIENISYTNKDFAQIYPELVELVKETTDKWDPELSNESDPGLVLLKTNAFIGDKNNYNIDKNILEQFIPSATQESAARANYEMLGYNMKYYRSATTNVYFKYTGGNSDIDEAFNTGDGLVTFKAFDTSFKTEDGITYTLIEDIELSSDFKSKTQLAIQGQLTCLNTSSTSSDSENSTKIQLYNLDDNNRIYFPDKNVAENGIFINKEYYNLSNESAWRRVNNLNDIELGEKVFKFSYDSNKGLPYIEFPQDIADLIGDGLEIWYILTDGISGYAANGTLTELNSYKIISNGQSLGTALDVDNYTISNSVAIGARNPETLTEAYNNYKKLIGTFNTLVSRRDYANAIYNYENLDTTHLISAVQVGDARTDINGVTQVLTRDNAGVSYYDYKIDSSKREYSDIVIHATIPVNTSVSTKLKYDQTYNIISDSYLYNIDNALYENKTLVHKLVLPEASDINMIQNQYSLNVNISTTYKVNDKEQETIIGNVLKALYENFNAREVDFGEEIPYDTIVKVIENADNRIKAVFLEDPEIKPYIVLGNNKIIPYTPEPNNAYNSQNKEILYKNIAAGRTPFYIEDTGFSYDFNQTDMEEYNIKNINAHFTLPGATNVTLKENETVQLLEDSYVSTLTYVYGTFYNLSLADSSTIIPADTVYELGANEELYIYYTDSSDNKVFKIYGEGDIIRPSGFDLKDTSLQGAGDNKNPSRWAYFENKDLKKSDPHDSNYTPLYCLAENESISLAERNEIILDSKNQKLFWYVQPKYENDPGTITFTNNTYVLDEGEFLIYPNDDMTSLCILSSGTKLYYEGGELKKIANDSIISLDDLNDCIESEDIQTFEKAFKWETIDFSQNNLSIIETVIRTAVEGDIVNYASNVTPQQFLTSDWTSLSEGWIIKINDDEYTSNNLNNLIARTVLSIIGNANSPQTIYPGQTFTLTIADDESSDSDEDIDITSGTIQIYPEINSFNNVFLGVISDYDEENKLYIYEYPYTLLHYNYIEDSSSDDNSFYDLIESEGLTKNNRNEYRITNINGTYTSQASSNLKISIFNATTQETIIQDGNEDIVLNSTNEYYVSIPKKLIINSDIPVSLQSELYTELSNIKFDFTAPLNKAKLIDSHTIFDAPWFFDKNNVYNDYVISKIDFANSKFKIVGSSKK